MDIDLTPLAHFLPELDKYLTTLYQQEYMKDYDMTSKTSMKIRINDNRVESIQVKTSLDNNVISAALYRDNIPVENDSNWEKNATEEANTLFPIFVQDWVHLHKDELTPQLIECIHNILFHKVGGAAS